MAMLHVEEYVFHGMDWRHIQSVILSSSVSGMGSDSICDDDWMSVEPKCYISAIYTCVPIQEIYPELLTCT